MYTQQNLYELMCLYVHEIVIQYVQANIFSNVDLSVACAGRTFQTYWGKVYRAGLYNNGIFWSLELKELCFKGYIVWHIYTYKMKKKKKVSPQKKMVAYIILSINRCIMAMNSTVSHYVVYIKCSFFAPDCPLLTMRIDKVKWITAHNCMWQAEVAFIHAYRVSWKGTFLGLDIVSQNVP